MPAGLIATTLSKPPISNASRAASVSWRQDKAAYREASPLEQTQKDRPPQERCIAPTATTTLLTAPLHSRSRRIQSRFRAATRVSCSRSYHTFTAAPSPASAAARARAASQPAATSPSCQLRTSVTIWLPSAAWKASVRRRRSKLVILRQTGEVGQDPLDILVQATDGHTRSARQRLDPLVENLAALRSGRYVAGHLLQQGCREPGPHPLGHLRFDAQDQKPAEKDSPLRGRQTAPKGRAVDIERQRVVLRQSSTKGRQNLRRRFQENKVGRADARCDIVRHVDARIVHVDRAEQGQPALAANRLESDATVKGHVRKASPNSPSSSPVQAERASPAPSQAAKAGNGNTKRAATKAMKRMDRCYGEVIAATTASSPPGTRRSGRSPSSRTGSAATPVARTLPTLRW